MPRRSRRRSPGDLPQRADAWHVVIQQLRAWIAEEDDTTKRPFVILVFNLEQGTIQKVELTTELPNAEGLLEVLIQAIEEPLAGQAAYRPSRIQIEEAELAAALAPEMEQLGIEVLQHPRHEEMNEVIQDLEGSIRGGPESAGLLEGEGVTPELVEDLFAAAADFYRAEPWVHLMDIHTLAIQVEPEEEPRFVQVMGGGGVEYGLAMYRRWEDVERIFSFVDDPMELLPPEGGHSFFFDDITRLPFDDVEALERYGWEVAEEQAYPVPVIYTPQGVARRPGRADLMWYEAALRAIPIFAREHLQPGEPGDFHPVEVVLSVPTHHGETKVHMTYPGGVLPKEIRPADMDIWQEFEEDDEEDDEEELASFDRRAMEGMMQLFSPGFGNPQLQKAQDLMYQAWEEQNPARRIILAHEALDISADCADAYVLLAEEEVDTLGRALEYYQQGVAAGERALGKKYFKENAGHFWGLLETRPYMRARQGLANTLWELDREKEAVEHYQDMLRLNPGDNQGIRYGLLNLLFSLNRIDEAATLIQQYEGDASAEWVYTRALLTFKENGAGKAADRVLKEALQTNPYVPDYLTGRERIPVRLPEYITWGGKDEAISYASSYLPHWRQTPGALEWLKDHLKPTASTRSRKTKSRRGGNKKES